MAHSPQASTTDPREDLFDAHNGPGFLSPADLRAARTPRYRALAIGTCFLEGLVALADTPPAAGTFDFVLVNNQAQGDFSAPAGIGLYDFQIVQLPVRIVLGEITAARLAYIDAASHKALFEAGCKRLRQQLKSRMKYNREAGLPTLVMNFPVPQFNAMGRLLPRYDLRNLEYFVERLNAELERLLRRYPQAFILDVDRIAASIGRRHVQDDSVYFSGHGAVLRAERGERNRIEARGGMGAHYELAPGAAFAGAVIAEAEAMWRTISQADAVKLVVIDLDDTLWRGVSGDAEALDHHMFAGWPYGFAEALLYLKKRGVLLAIISRNDEARVRAAWPQIVGPALTLEDFAVVCIEWRPKAEAMAGVLSELRLLPRSTVFIDDNPAERAAVQAAFPDIRVLGSHPFYVRRILLLAPELQGVDVSAESARRTQMVQARAAREAARADATREDFLAQQETQVLLREVRDMDSPRFARALELINKTNQFNTTGKRWMRRDCAEHFRRGGVFIVYDVIDRFAAYGLVGVVILRKWHIVQWVMSCRVIGMGVEQAVLSALAARPRGPMTADLVETEANNPCRGVYAAAGFERREEFWRLMAGKAVPMPPYVRLVEQA